MICLTISPTGSKLSRQEAADEPNNVAKAVATMKLNHAVITSVDRDDLPDYGAGHWVETRNGWYWSPGRWH